MQGSGVAERATGSHGLLKCRALTALDVYSAIGRPWCTSWQVSKGLGLSGWDVPRGKRASLLQGLGKWSGHYSVVSRGRIGPWPPAWRLCQRRPAVDPMSDHLYEYSLTRHGLQWLKHSRTRAELRCGLASGSVVSEVTALLGLTVYFHIEDRRGRSGFWAIMAPFDVPGGWVGRIQPVDGAYQWPVASDVTVKAESAFDAVKLVTDRLGMTIGQELLRDIVAADIGVAFKS